MNYMNWIVRIAVRRNNICHWYHIEQHRKQFKSSRPTAATTVSLWRQTCIGLCILPQEIVQQQTLTHNSRPTWTNFNLKKHMKWQLFSRSGESFRRKKGKFLRVHFWGHFKTFDANTAVNYKDLGYYASTMQKLS